MTNLVDRYYAVLDKVGVDDFERPELEAIRQQMTDAERSAVIARLREEGEAALKEAEALKKFGERKGFSRRER